MKDFFIKYYINTKLFPKEIKNQNGQSLLEFVLLLAIISTVGFGMLRVVNTNIAKYWAFFANIILDDPNIKLNL